MPGATRGIGEESLGVNQLHAWGYTQIPSLGTPPTPEFYPMEDFQLEQSRDDTLCFAFDQVKAINGQPVHPDAAPSHPYFSIIKDGL